MVMPFSQKETSTSQLNGTRWTTDLKHLPVIAASSANILAKTTATTASSMSTSAGFVALARRGANASISSADVWVTITNISGGGFFVSAISPTHTAGHIPSIKITVDGVAYTFAPTSSLAAAHRMVVGFVTKGIALTIADGYVVGQNGANDSGFDTALTGGVPISGATIGLVSPESALITGTPLVRFNKSLKVEAKCNFLSANADDRFCGAVYKLDL